MPRAICSSVKPLNLPVKLLLLRPLRAYLKSAACPLASARKTTRPAGGNSLQQQSKFDDFLEEFNNERPHEALDMKCPAEVYTPAIRRYGGLPELAYPFHDRVIHVTNWGRICLHRKKINLSTVFAGQALGIKEVEEGIWLVSFMGYDLGYIDLEEKTLQPLNNPFGPKV